MSVKVTPQSGGSGSVLGLKLSAYTPADAHSVADVTVTSGNNQITSASAHFLATAQVGQSIIVGGAGGGGTAPLRTTIAAVVNDTTLQLTATPTSSATNAGASWGTDASAGLHAALAAGVGNYRLTVDIDGSFLIASAMAYDLAGQVGQVVLNGGGTGALIFALASNARGIEIDNVERLRVTGLKLYGTLSVNTECDAAIFGSYVAEEFLVDNCLIAGLSGTSAVIGGNQTNLRVKDCSVVGCTTSGGSGSGVVRLWTGSYGLQMENVEFIDAAGIDGQWRSTAVKSTPTDAWIRVDAPNGTPRTQIRSGTGIYLKNVMMDEAGKYGLIVNGGTGRWKYIELDNVMVNGGFTTGARCVSITKAARVVLKNCAGVYRSATPAVPAFEFVDAGIISLDTCEALATCNQITADAACTRIELKNCTYTTLSASCPSAVDVTFTNGVYIGTSSVQIAPTGGGGNETGLYNAGLGVGYALKWNSTGLAFFGGTPVAKPTVTGSKGANAALASLLTALANLGLVTDSSS